MTRTRYGKPPVIEVMIDIQVRFPEGRPSLDELSDLGSKMLTSYPKREELYSFGIEVNPNSGTEVRTSRDSVGYRYWNEARDRIVHIRTNGLLFSRLPSAMHPYDEWEVSFGEMQRLWPLYRSALRPHQIVRLGVRYINRIRLPVGAATLDEFFTARPELPSGIPLAVQSFVMRTVVPLPDVDGGVLVLGQGTVDDATTPAGRTDVLLDLDLTRQVLLGPTEDDTPIWGMIEQLHQKENDLFETFITPTTRQLFSDDAP